MLQINVGMATDPHPLIGEGRGKAVYECEPCGG